MEAFYYFHKPLLFAKISNNLNFADLLNSNFFSFITQINNQQRAQMLNRTCRISNIWLFANHKHTKTSTPPGSISKNPQTQGSSLSIKKTLSFIVLTTVLLLCPSIQADIVYEVLPAEIPASQSYSLATANLGNTFSNSSSPSLINSVSLYLYNNGVLDDAGTTYYATGTLSLGIYATTKNNTTGLYDISGDVFVSASINLSTVPDAGLANLYTFDFTGAKIADRALSAGTRYAFYTDFSGASDIGALYFGTNNTAFPDQNIIFGGIGSPGQSMVGTVDVTAVPEPGTLILTGSALLAGAIGVYFTRRHKDQALTPAAV